MIGKSFKLMIAMVMLCSMVMAIPGIPHQFYGSVQVNGNPASGGTEVVAKIDGTTVSSGITSGGKFGYAPNIFIITDANGNRAGKTVHFYAAGKDTGVTATFGNGGSTQLDFSVTVSTGGNGGNGGGGGGGGGGSGYTTTTTTNGTTGTTVESTPTTEHTIAEYQVGDLHIIRSYYYTGDHVVMKLVYENTGDETLFNIDIIDSVGGDFGAQTAYFSSIAPGEKKYDEYELGKWVSLYQMNGFIEGAGAPEVTVGQVGGEAPEPEKPESTPRDEGVIPPSEDIEPDTPSLTGLFALGGGMFFVGVLIVVAIIIIAVYFYTKKKPVKTNNNKNNKNNKKR